jgi:hypothetical protein
MRFYKVTVSGTFLPDTPSTRKLGDVGSKFLEIHADDFFGDLTGDVTGDVTGDLTGDVKADDGNSIISSGADVANSWVAVGSLKAADGDDVLVTNATAENSTFAGIADRAKYA